MSVDRDLDDIAAMVAVWGNAKLGVLEGDNLRALYRNQGKGLEVVGWLHVERSTIPVYDNAVSIDMRAWLNGIFRAVIGGTPFVIGVAAPDGLFVATIKSTDKLGTWPKFYLPGNPYEDKWASVFPGARADLQDIQFRRIGEVRPADGNKSGAKGSSNAG